MAYTRKSRTMVELETKDGVRQSFALEHAERILSMGTFGNGGWRLPVNSKYIYDEENGSIRTKTSSSDSAKARE